jgi:hypothetical protein
MSTHQPGIPAHMEQQYLNLFRDVWRLLELVYPGLPI